MRDDRTTAPRRMTATADLPTGDELASILDAYDDQLLAADVRGLLEQCDIKPASLHLPTAPRGARADG